MPEPSSVNHQTTTSPLYRNDVRLIEIYAQTVNRTSFHIPNRKFMLTRTIWLLTYSTQLHSKLFCYHCTVTPCSLLMLLASSLQLHCTVYTSMC